MLKLSQLEMRARNMKARMAIRDKRKENKREKLSPVQYVALLESQDNKCAICGKQWAHVNYEGLYADHCHATGKARGLLCNRCNSALGYFNDDTGLLEKSITYLKKYE